MVGKKLRTKYNKKKSKRFSGVPSWAKNRNESAMSEENINLDPQPSTSTCSQDSADDSQQTSTCFGASRLKLGETSLTSDNTEISDDELGNNDELNTLGYRLIDTSILSSTLSDIHRCEEGELCLRENTSLRAGLMSDFSIECTSCNTITPMATSTTISNRGRSFDVNRRAVYHTLETGGGYESLSTFCGIMNMPCISKKAYQEQVDVILEAQESEAQAELTKAGKKLRNVLVQESDDELATDDILDVTVSFDGTWAKRGFTSLFGVFFVMSVDTGEVLDYHVLSKSCQQCLLKKSLFKDCSEKFEEWKVNHINNGDCYVNFEGSSPAMEAEAAMVLWQRSIEKHQMRYRYMVSDGDSKSFSSVENVYGDVKVEKIDCVGHVQKRMGKRLLKLKSNTKGKLDDGKTIGGRGRLTEVKIKQFQRYYGLAIRQNTIKKPNPTEVEVNVAVYAMKKNIIATLTHSIQSSSLESQHKFCPPGANSWCKWQQDKATGTKTYKPADNILPGVFLEVLRPVFMALSDSKLLARCVRGATQNRNECINSLVWIRCPKHKFHSAKVVRFAVASAVCHFHSGAASREGVMFSLAIPGGAHTETSCYNKDRKRVAKSDLQASEKFKRRREGEQLLKTRREEALREVEGVSYEAGGF